MKNQVPLYKQYLGSGNSFGRVAVLYGGSSEERTISLLSGEAVIAALREASIDLLPIDLGENPLSQLMNEQFDRAFIALHGEGGEDGKIQAALDLLEIPYTGSRHTASAIAMDKLLTKQIWQSVGLPTPDYQIINESSRLADDVFKRLGAELFVKPVHEGSSIGMRCVSSLEELLSAVDYAKTYDRKVLVETRINGPEFSVAILNGVALPPIRLKASNTFYDYEAKYESEQTQYQCPADLTREKASELCCLAESAFSVIGCRGWGRVDVMQNETEDFFLLEINTVPGMTSHSLVPMAAKAAGLSFADLVCEILMDTVTV